MQEEAVSEKHVKMMKEHFYVGDLEMNKGLFQTAGTITGIMGLALMNLKVTFNPANSWIVTEESLVSFYRFLAKENDETVIETLIEKPSRLLGFESWPFEKLSKDEQIRTILPATETSKLFFKSN